MDEIVVTPSWRERLERIRGSRKESWVLVAVLGAAILGALVLWTRGAPAVVAPPAQASAEGAPAAEALGATPPEGGVVLVHVAGAVRRPGLYELPAGTRVADAIDSAGGPRRNADLDTVNLAQVLSDAMKVEIPTRGEAVSALPSPEATPGVAVGGTTTSAGVVSLNGADLAALEAIPGIGPVKAAAILQYRDEVGGFSSVEELLDVTGIGPATLESIRPYVTI